MDLTLLGGWSIVHIICLNGKVVQLNPSTLSQVAA